MRPIDRLLNAIETSTGKKPRGKAPKWKCCCPHHEDNGPSLAVDELGDGRILIHCFAGCSSTNVLSAIGLSLTDLFPESLKQKIAPVVLRMNPGHQLRGDRAIERDQQECQRLRDENHELAEENIQLRKSLVSLLKSMKDKAA